MIKFIFSLVAFVSMIVTLAVPSHSQESIKEYNAVRMEIYRNGKLIGRPNMVVQMGTYAVSTYAADDGYSVKVRLDRGADRDKTRIVDIELHSARNDRWVLRGHPVITTRIDSSNVVSMPGPAGDDMSVKFVVVENQQNAALGKFGRNACTKAKLAARQASMERPVSALKVALQQGDPCCRVCKNVTCCSAGPMCCSDPYLCPDRSCCNGM